MAVAIAERSLFRGKDTSVTKLEPGTTVDLEVLHVFPVLIEGFLKILEDSKVELQSFSHDDTIESTDEYIGEEINKAHIRTPRTRLFSRRPEIRCIPD